MKKKLNRNRKAAQDTAAPATVPEKLNELFDIPSNALLGLPQIELAGNREAIVDGCRGVLEYDEAVVKLATAKMSIRFTGRNLQIKVLTHDSAIVTGYITGIEFLT